MPRPLISPLPSSMAPLPWLLAQPSQALWVTGDAVRPVPVHTQPFSEASINEWLESTRMVSGTGTGTASIGNIQGNQFGIDTNNESTK